VDKKLENLTNLIEKVSAASNANPCILFARLETLHKVGMPKDTKVICRKANWNGMQFQIIPDGYLEFDDNIYIIPFEIETSLRYPKFDYEDYESR